MAGMCSKGVADARSWIRGVPPAPLHHRDKLVSRVLASKGRIWVGFEGIRGEHGGDPAGKESMTVAQ